MADFSRLLAPVPLARFVREHWQRRPLYVEGGADKLAWLDFGPKAFTRALRAAAKVDREFSAPPSLKAQFLDPIRGNRELRIAPSQVRRMFDAGMTIGFHGIERFHEPLRRVVSSTKLALGEPGHVGINCYYSPHEKGFGLHFDHQSVFILQIEGQKKWSYSRRPFVESPPNGMLLSERSLREWRAMHPHLRLRAPRKAELVDVVLRPGDVLYLPPGCWHTARARDSSLALTLTVQPIRFMDLVLDVIAQRVAKERVLAHPPPGVPPALITGAPRGVNRYLQAALERLQREIGTLTIEDLGDAWCNRIVSGARAPGPKRAAPLGDSKRLRVRNPIYVRADADGALLDLEDRRLRVNRVALDLLKRLAKQPAFVLPDAEDALGPLGKKAIALLLENGLLEAAPIVGKADGPKRRRKRRSPKIPRQPR